MKGNMKKLVLALSLGLVLGSSAFAQPTGEIYRDGIWTIIDSPAHGLAIGDTGSVNELCEKTLVYKRKISGGHTYTLNDAYAKVVSSKTKLMLNCDERFKDAISGNVRESSTYFVGTVSRTN